jgi:hypothetical protein
LNGHGFRVQNLSPVQVGLQPCVALIGDNRNELVEDVPHLPSHLGRQEYIGQGSQRAGRWERFHFICCIPDYRELIVFT